MLSDQRLFNQPLFNRPLFDRPQFERRPIHDPALGPSSFVLEPRVNQPSRSVTDVLRDHSIVAPPDGFALGDDGMLLVDETPRRALFPIAPDFESWRMTARLLSRRRRLVAALDIEIDIRAPGSTLVQLRPIDRRPQRWSARHQRRYFALAHAGADRLEQVLNNHASVDLVIEAARHDPSVLATRPRVGHDAGSSAWAALVIHDDDREVAGRRSGHALGEPGAVSRCRS